MSGLRQRNAASFKLGFHLRRGRRGFGRQPKLARRLEEEGYAGVLREAGYEVDATDSALDARVPEAVEAGA